MESTRGSRWRPSWILDLYATWVVGLRWLVVAFWLVATAAAVFYLPPIGHGGSDLEKLVSADNPAAHSELRSFEKFGFPLLSRLAVVQRDPQGLPLQTQAEAVQRARDVSQGAHPDAKPIIAAVPIANTLKLFPGSEENGTTIITLLFADPQASFADQAQAAQRFVDERYDDGDAVVGVTGSVPARVEQGRIVLASLTWLEIATIVAVFLIVAVAFRSISAALVALGVAGVAVVLTLYIGGYLAQRLGVPVPQETQPLVVALLLGVVTDYVVFYLSAMRSELASGIGRLEAAESATAKFTPIIATAGATAAAGTGALIVAGSPTFRAFGPGMALAVLIGMVVAVTLVPAVLAIVGHRVLRPAAGVEERAPSGWFARLLTRPAVALVVLAGCVGGLIAATTPARDMALGVSFMEALPQDNPTRQASQQAQVGFADGILSPSEVLVEGAGVASREAELARLRESLSRTPGVAAVLGPGDELVPEMERLFHAPDGTAVRFLLVLSDEPLGARAVKTMSRLDDELPGMLTAAGLSGTQASLGGDSAIAKEVVNQTTRDLWRIAIASLAANLLFLMLFLRAFAAPVGLLLCSVLAIGATLGLTTWVFQGLLGNDGLTFYVPFAAAVLLVALGSDYNIFGVGPAWKEARARPLREALAVTLPQSARAIRTAAITLAVSFGLLALVPLRPFRELAFALSVGILIDAFVVRSLLAPALLTVMEYAGEMPRRLLRLRVRPETPPAQ